MCYTEGVSLRPVSLQGLLDGQNALMANLAGSMLQQQGASYLQKGQAFMQQRMGFLSSSLLQSYFSVGGGYGGLRWRMHPLAQNVH